MTEKINIRELALAVLLEAGKKEQKSSQLIHSVLEKYQYLPRQDRAFFTRLCQGTLEYRLQLDYILDVYSRVPARKMKPVVREILRMAVYQLKYMDSIPDSAAVNEAVKLAGRKGLPQLKGFINGVLRAAARGLQELSWPEKTDRVRFLSVRYSMPEYLVEKWLKELGAEATENMLRAFLLEEPLTVRIRGGSTERENALEELREQGVLAEKAPYVQSAYYLKKYDKLEKLTAFRRGRLQVQDVSSMLAAEAAAPAEGSLILDLCAAPGGKSLYLADLAGEGSLVIARDLTPGKVQLIRENADRCGAGQVRPEQWDACETDPEMIEKADTVLADVPCSGYGVIGRKPDIKYRASAEREDALVELQRKILTNAVAYVKPGGVLLYSTCTVNYAENQGNAKWLAGNFPLEPESLDPFLPQELRTENTGRGFLQLLPGAHSCDGFFMARFRKKKMDGER